MYRKMLFPSLRILSMRVILTNLSTLDSFDTLINLYNELLDKI
jgi:hypothetical protein